MYDRFHEYNTKDPRDTLRRVQVVPELCEWVNTQTAEQLFAAMCKNNYFLNMLAPSGRTCLMRKIIHHYNIAQNKNMEDSIRKVVSPSDQSTLNGYGQIVLGKFFLLLYLTMTSNFVMYCKVTFSCTVCEGTPPQSLNDSERFSFNITQTDQVH